MYTNEEIEIGIKSIVALNEVIDERLNVRHIAYTAKDNEYVNIDIYCTEGYDFRLEKEVVNKKGFILPRADWYKKGIFEIYNFIESLEGIVYDEEIDKVSERIFDRDENQFEYERGN